MITNDRKPIELTEYSSVVVPEKEISKEAGVLIRKNYKKYINIEFPNFYENNWRLSAEGWVGRILLPSEMEIVVQPKVSISNIFGMLEYAYRLKEFKILEGLTNCRYLDEFYESFAKILAGKIMDRGRKGFFRSYEKRNTVLPYLRGRLDMKRTILKPWEVKPECCYDEFTLDIEDNQILIWTLQRILCSGLCTDRSLLQVLKAQKTLQGFVTSKYYSSNDCSGRIYNRLNQDYKLMHLLCQFFLENSGPTHLVGDYSMMPFLLDMSRLYELFVSEWLRAHESFLPDGFSIRPLEKVVVGDETKFRFEIDLVLYKNGKACCVLDTKYKEPDIIKNEDLYQIHYYADLKGTQDAILIYPRHSKKIVVPPSKSGIRVRSLYFSLEGDLDEAGFLFLDELKKIIA
jgi:5-methylcytosine-specific restriction enzyme subunit McrC